MIKMTKNEAKVSYTVSTKEEAVITYNDMASIPPCNSIVFRAGDSPIWNRNETALPMSWRLFKNTITNPGKEYTLQTIPTLSTAKDFDVKQNQPNFTKMFDKRVKQAAKAETAMQYYKDVYGLTDDEIQRLDVDVYADDIMEIISTMIHPNIDVNKREENADPDEVLDLDVEPMETIANPIKDDSVEQAMATDERIQRAQVADKKIYANGQISRNDLYNPNAGGANHALDAVICSIYYKCRNHFSRDSQYFMIDKDNNLRAAGNGEVYIYGRNNAKIAEKLNDMAQDPDSRVYSEDNITQDAVFEGTVTDAFYKFLIMFDQEWPFIRGEFARQMAAAQRNGNISAE